MFKNLKPGDFVTLIPIGLPITLQYNISGNLEKVYSGYDVNRTDITDDVMTSLLDINKVPGKISLDKGTSWVTGVLYTNATVSGSGKLPDAISDKLLDLYKDNPMQFNFFAANISCTSMSFSGSIHVKNYLNVAKFNVLPSWYVPAKMTPDIFEQWLRDPTFTFQPIVTDMQVYSDANVNLISTGISQYMITNVKNHIDDSGYLRLAVSLEGVDAPKYVDFPDGAKCGVATGNLLYFDKNHQIIGSHCFVESKYPTDVRCKFCGKMLHVPESGTMACTDPHCCSRMYPAIQHFIAELGLNVTMTKTEAMVSYKIHSISDMLLCEKFDGVTIEAPLAKLLRALVPIEVLPNKAVISDFITACTESADTVKYYVMNPGLIKSDLKIINPQIDKLIAWLEDDFNASEVTTVLTADNVKVVSADHRFNGAPIFRDKLICLTGDFIHGSHELIVDILRSYSAKVTTVFTNSVDCVLVGGTAENIDGKTIVAARNMGKAVMGEVEFFKYYDIDSDLNNLL